MATDVETTVTSEFSSEASLPAESNISSSIESDSSSSQPSPESDSESDLELSSRRKAPPKRHADDTDSDKLDSNKPKCTRTETNSSIRVALQKNGPPTGILRFFHKATEEERQESLKRLSEENQEIKEDLYTREIVHHSESLRKKNKERRQARERKHAQRVWMRKPEIAAGLRSPTGKKCQV
jgi:hypothetical protein